MMKSLISLSLLVSSLSISLLASCATQVPYTPQDRASDEAIKQEVRQAFNAEKYTFLDHVDITVYQGTVILGGLVFEAVDKDVALSDARRVPGVKAISDQIEIESNAW